MDELVKTIVANLPNFIGLVYAVYAMREQNNRLMDLLRECYGLNDKVTG
jgi:hypothetical protein